MISRAITSTGLHAITSSESDAFLRSCFVSSHLNTRLMLLSTTYSVVVMLPLVILLYDDIGDTPSLRLRVVSFRAVSIRAIPYHIVMGKT